MKKIFSTTLATLAALSILASSALACTDIIVGKKASTDGSVITSHTADGAFYDARVEVIPGKTFKKGEMASVYWNLTNEEYGDPVKIGEIPQVEKTYSYFKMGYPFMNEKKVAIGETTLGQKEILKTFRPDARAIMTIEQLETFGLQRAATAREAVQVIGDLAVKYGFMPSCGSEGECITITDPEEAWIFEVHSTGMMWTQESGKPGAVWVAQRVPDDMVVVVPNMSRIREVDPEDSDNFMVSEHYKQFAIDTGLYDPASGEEFIWQEIYSPLTGNDGWSMSSMWIRNRLHVIHKILAPSREWDPNAEIMSYPFAIKPEKKVSVQDVMEMLRSHMEGTPFDMYEDPAWFIKEREKSVKSPLATPFPTKDVRRLLKIDYNRPVSKWDCAYSFVSQMRDDLPGLLWFGMDNPHTTCYVPVYCQITDTPKSWRTFDRNKFSLDSAQWAFILCDELVNHRYADAMKDLRAVRDDLENGFFAQQTKIEKEAVELAKKDPTASVKYLTDYTAKCMNEVEDAWWNLNWTLITKYNNNKIH